MSLVIIEKHAVVFENLHQYLLFGLALDQLLERLELQVVSVVVGRLLHTIVLVILFVNLVDKSQKLFLGLPDFHRV